jgi:plastocyanin
MWKAVAAGSISVALLGAACGASGGSGGGGVYGAGAAGSSASPTASGPSGGTSGSSGSGGGRYGYGTGSSGATGSTGSGGVGGTSVLTLTQVNYRFSPGRITVTSGDTITVSDTNPSTPHTFTIYGTNIDVSNNPQQSQDVTIDLQPGTYAFFCRFHKALGMKGTLVVK